MNEFGFLSVLLSIILGFAITQLLQGIRGRILCRGQVRDYWPTQVWAGTLLLVCAQTWWAMFTLRDRHAWSFVQFGVLLAQVTLIYLVAGLVYPDFTPTGNVDLRAHYYRNHRFFFGLLAVAAVVSILRDVVLNGSLPERFNTGFHLVFLTAAVIGAVTSSETYHRANTLFMVVAFLGYVVFLFARLH